MFSASNYHPVMLELRLAQGSKVREKRGLSLWRSRNAERKRVDSCLGTHLLLGLGWTCFNILILPHPTEVL